MIQKYRIPLSKCSVCVYVCVFEYLSFSSLCLILNK